MTELVIYVMELNGIGKKAVLIRFDTSTNIDDLSFFRKEYTSKSKSIQRLDLLKKAIKDSADMRDQIRIQAIESMTPILGSDSRYVQSAIQSMEETKEVHWFAGVI